MQGERLLYPEHPRLPEESEMERGRALREMLTEFWKFNQQLPSNDYICTYVVKFQKIHVQDGFTGYGVPDKCGRNKTDSA
jgi:hypothetical protein